VAYSARIASPMRTIQMSADVDGQVVKYGAFGDSLQAFDANVADGKSILSRLRLHSRADRLAGKRRQQGYAKFKPHAAKTGCNIGGRRCAGNSAGTAGIWV